MPTFRREDWCGAAILASRPCLGDILFLDWRQAWSLQDMHFDARCQCIAGPMLLYPGSRIPFLLSSSGCKIEANKSFILPRSPGRASSGLLAAVSNSDSG